MLLDALGSLVVPLVVLPIGLRYQLQEEEAVLLAVVLLDLLSFTLLIYPCSL